MNTVANLQIYNYNTHIYSLKKTKKTHFNSKIPKMK